ncbi:MAG: hypothetical protein LBS66_01565 [Rhodospirillaceae bacterium]|jgi:CBS domain containing-hemolysin-like protein|nr:hypothetical protein [Rhodospirillaceae bacterium]
MVGAIDRLITIEDIIEHIVGKIGNEHGNNVDPYYNERPDIIIEADARLSLEYFETKVGSLLDKENREDVDTLGGLVIFLAGMVPSCDELINHNSVLEFEIIDADPRRVKHLRIRNIPKLENCTAIK